MGDEKVRSIKGRLPWASVWLILCSTASAQTIRIGAVSGKQGQTMSVPVTLTGSSSYTAALVRVQYNTAVLENVGVAAGALLSPVHVIESNAPAAGRFDVAVYAPAGMPSFKAKTGTLFSLTFRIKSNAPLGVSPITFTTAGTPSLPSADLVSVSGAAVSPSTVAGSVTVGAAAVGTPWTVYE